MLVKYKPLTTLNSNIFGGRFDRQSMRTCHLPITTRVDADGPQTIEVVVSSSIMFQCLALAILASPVFRYLGQENHPHENAHYKHKSSYH